MSLLRLSLPASQPPTQPSRLSVRSGVIFGRSAVVLGLMLLGLAACGSTPAAATNAGSTDSCDVVLPASCPAPAPSYAADVAPILGQFCTSCHQPGNAESGIDLTSYTTVYANREPVLAQVYNCDMPLSGAPSLSTTQVTTLLSWLVCEAPNN